MNLPGTARLGLLLFELDAFFVLFYVTLLVVAVFLRRFINFLDRRRIHAYIEQRGGKVLDIASRWFGPGWFSGNGRIYDVTYRTPQGRTLSATCKTGMFSGVYWTGEALPGGMSDDQELT